MNTKNQTNSRTSTRTSQHPHSKGFILSIRLCLLLAAVAHLFASVFFQKDLATSWEGTVPHLAIALLSVVGAISGTHGSVIFGRRGELMPLVCCVAVLVMSAGLTALSATGFYSAESRRAAKSEQALTVSANLDSQQIDTLRSQITALQGSGGGEGTSPRLTQLRQQRAEMVTQREAYAEKNIISAGVKPTQARIDAVDVEIATVQSDLLASHGAATKANSDRLTSLQTQLSEAIASAKQTGQAAPKNVSSADALFESLGHNWGVPAETVRAKFLFWQPIILEVMSILLSLISASLSPVESERHQQRHNERADYEQEHQPEPVRFSPPTRPRDIANAVSADAQLREYQPTAKRAPEPVEEAEEEEEETEETESTGKTTIRDYVQAIFQGWTPESPKLTGKDEVGRRLGINQRQVRHFHSKVRGSKFYQVDRARQPWARIPGVKTKEQASNVFIETI
jgi:hypothetical protein